MTGRPGCASSWSRTVRVAGAGVGGWVWVTAVRYQLQVVPDLVDGDVLVSNHPQAGGSHLPDITVITPGERRCVAMDGSLLPAPLLTCGCGSWKLFPVLLLVTDSL